MKEPSLIEFDDDIIIIQKNIIKNLKKITSSANKLFPYLYKYIEKTQFISQELFTLLNYYINYDKDSSVIFGQSKNERYVILL